jgi:hypothetical protein
MYIDVVVQHDPDLNMTDQIQVPLSVWEQYATSDDTPTFMRVNGSAVGRIVPAEIQNACRIPAWIWSLCGEVDFVELEPVVLPIATSITLKPRIQDSEPVDLETMSAAISASWACLSVGATLQLVCGTYDIITILAADTEVPAACILDCDVDLVLLAEGKQDERAGAIEPVHDPVHDPVHEPIDFSQMFTPKTEPNKFPGQGRTLGGQGRRLG